MPLGHSNEWPTTQFPLALKRGVLVRDPSETNKHNNLMHGSSRFTYVELLVFAPRARRPHVLVADGATAASPDGLPMHPFTGGERLEATAERFLAAIMGADAADIRCVSLTSRPCWPAGTDRVRTRFAGFVRPDADPGPEWRWIPVGEAVRGSVDDDVVLGAFTEMRYAMVQKAIAAAWCRPAFTMTDLREVYEIMWGATFDAGGFTVKLQRSGVLHATGTFDRSRGGRNAMLYRVDPDAKFANPIEPRVEFFDHPLHGLA